VSEQVTAEEVRRLLLAYEVALDAAESLPPLLRIATRSRRWTLFEPLRRLPRSTLGTSTMVTYHVQRSTAALARRYARIAATRGLTDEDKRASELVKSFRDSLPGIRWKIIVPAALIGALTAIDVLFRIIVPAIDVLTFQLISPISDRNVGRLADALERTISSLSPDSFVDLLDQVGKGGPAGMLALVTTVVVVGYLLARPLYPAFRVKRILFNLAGTGHIDPNRTTMTWNVPRSDGLYSLERTLFSCLGAQAPNEANFDLWVSIIPVAGFMWLAVAFFVPDFLSFPELLVLTAGFVAARLAWLHQSARARRRSIAPTALSAGFIAAGTDRIVETRPVLETASFSIYNFTILTFFPLLFPFFLPWPVWVRLVRERRDLEPAFRRIQVFPRGLPSRRVWPAVGSALLFSVLPPLPLAVHLTRLVRLQPPGTGSARRTRAWVVPLASAAALLFYLYLYLLGVDYNFPMWDYVLLIPMYAVVAAAIGAIQHEHNALIRHVGQPRPHDDPLWKPEPNPTAPRQSVRAHMTRAIHHSS
jgi:hypothetical protein